MAADAPLATVAILGRMPGYYVLRDALIGNPSLKLAGVFTHGRLPKAEGGAERPELALYRSLCAEHGVPLTVLDGPEAKALEAHLPPTPLDLMVSLSWRFVVTRAVLDRLSLGAINLHRGQLPEFAGAEPVRRAFEAGRTRLAITAHVMTEGIDEGPEIARVFWDASHLADLPLPQRTEIAKEKLEPLYAPLARMAVAALAER